MRLRTVLRDGGERLGERRGDLIGTGTPPGIGIPRHTAAAAATAKNP